MRYIKLLIYIFTLLFLASSPLKPVVADTSHEGDITLTGDDVFVIENTTYTQTGNIHVKDNAKLTIRNSTLIFNQRYHEEFAIRIEGNGTFEVQNSTIKTGILPLENYEIRILDEAHVEINNSDFTNEGYLQFGGSCATPNFKASASISDSKFRAFWIMFTSSGGPSIHVSNSETYNLTFRFDDYQGDFSDLKPGYFEYWRYNKGSYSITLENTNVFGNISLHCDGPAQVTVRNSEFFQLGCRGLSTIRLRLVDSVTSHFCLHGFSNFCTVQLSNLATGLHNQWSFQDHATGNCVPDVILENSEITDGWYVSSFGSTLSIDNSNLSRLGSYGFGSTQSETDVTSVSNSVIEWLMFYYSTARLIFDDTTIRDVGVYLPSNSIVEGNISFTPDAYVSYWLDSTIKRIYPVLLVDSNNNTIPNANLFLYSKNDDLLWTGVTDSDGKSSFEIEFNDNNYTDPWKLIIDYDGQSISKEIKFLSSTPIGLNDPPTANAGPDQTVGEGATVTLDGSNSTDPDDGIASYQWQQTGGTSVTLSDTTAVQPTFTSPDVGPDGESLTFQLTVTDNAGLEDTDICMVNVTNVGEDGGDTGNGGGGDTDDGNEGVGNGIGDGRCFIAMATYGSPMAEEVKVLKDFRDHVLLKNSVGRAFVACYYKASPSLANYIRKYGTLITAARVTLTPVVYGVKYSRTSFLIFLSSVIGLTLVFRARRSNRF